MRRNKRSTLAHESDTGPDAEQLRTAREALRGDCARCIGLCCIAPTFSASSDFAIDKRAGERCPNLERDARCSIHTVLRERGFRGCTVYDCFGAGQRLCEENARASAPVEALYAQLPLLKQLHEMCWYLREALALPAARSLHTELSEALRTTEQHAGASEARLALDLAAHRASVGALLARVSELVRARVPGKQRDRRNADLIGKPLRAADLRGASLRGALLIAADLRDANLTYSDLLGADLRDTDLRGADLTGSLFLTQSQLEAARGDSRTKLPGWLARPPHWEKAGKRALPRMT